MEDVESLVTLLAQLGHPLSEMEVKEKIDVFTANDFRLLVCEIGQQPVGFISLHWFDKFHSIGKTGRITALCVDKDTRQQGVGGMLLAAAEQVLRENGCREIEVTTNMRRSRTPDFYKKHGYQQQSHHFVKSLWASNASHE